MNVYIPLTGFATQGPCAEGFHVPMKSEWEGVNTIMLTLNLLTRDDYVSKLHIPLTGLRLYSTSNVSGQGSTSYAHIYRCIDYFSSVSNSTLRINSDGTITMDDTYKGHGNSIRPFHNGYVVPTSSWTVIEGTLGSAGIFRDTVNGLISITGDGTTGYTIADKNCGATTVYNSGDTLSEANCGKYYQYGNNYGFTFTGAVTTSSTQVNASGYGPGNYYSSSTFITQETWDSSNNNNLRGGVTGIVPAELKNAYIGEYADWLCFTANTAGSTIQLTKTGSPTAVTLETSTDGNTWSNYTIGNTITLSNIGDKVYWRNISTTDTGFSIDTSNYYKFVMIGSISADGDINFLLNKDSTDTLSGYCYNNLFNSCTSLTTAPKLPATTLAQACYRKMFRGCKGLTTSPELPATTLATSCYINMFTSCTNLTTIPKLPVITLPDGCYREMFKLCSKIKLSSTQTGEYKTAYRIPVSGTGTAGTNSLYLMFQSTGGTFKSTPTINTTYYTSNTVV